jgi:hypothetical protein
MFTGAEKPAPTKATQSPPAKLSINPAHVAEELADVPVFDKVPEEVVNALLRFGISRKTSVSLDCATQRDDRFHVPCAF